MEVVNTLGRRKAAVARAYIKDGKGEIVINGRTIENFFPLETLRYIVKQPLLLVDAVEKYDIKINLNGGGIKGQAEAARLAITRAMIEIDEESRAILKKNGLTTRDPRVVERKKPGQPKARKQFQFSKR